MGLDFESKHTRTNIKVSGGHNQRIANLEALKLERQTMIEIREEKIRAIKKIILCAFGGMFCLIPWCFIPKWVMIYRDADKYLQKLKYIE